MPRDVADPETGLEAAPLWGARYGRNVYHRRSPRLLWHRIVHRLFGPWRGCTCSRCFHHRSYRMRGQHAIDRFVAAERRIKKLEDMLDPRHPNCRMWLAVDLGREPPEPTPYDLTPDELMAHARRELRRPVHGGYPDV